MCRRPFGSQIALCAQYTTWRCWRKAKVREWNPEGRLEWIFTLYHQLIFIMWNSELYQFFVKKHSRVEYLQTLEKYFACDSWRYVFFRTASWELATGIEKCPRYPFLAVLVTTFITPAGCSYCSCYDKLSHAIHVCVPARFSLVKHVQLWCPRGQQINARLPATI